MLQRPFFLHRPWRRRRWYADPHWVAAILAVILLIFFFRTVNSRIRPILTAMATTGVSNAVTAAVNNAILDGIAAEHISYRDMVQMEIASDGRVSALTSNLGQANLLRAQMLSLVLEAVSELSSEDFSIPMGNLTDIDLFSGRGPDVTVDVLSTGTAKADFAHEFVDAGVNQTLHRILLELEVEVQILLPGETIELPVSTRVCIAETVIVGQVPDTYLEWEH